MTDIGNANSTRASDLTELALAPSPSEGNHQMSPCGNEWCPDGPRCEHPTYLRWVERSPASIEYYTQTRNTTALAYAVHNLARYQALVDDHERRCEARRRYFIERTNRANAKSKLGPWEFTLTYSPKQHGWNRDEAMEHMRTAIERLTRYYREEIEEFHATGELNAAGDPHVHAWYRLDGGRKITTKSFQRAYPIWNPKIRTGPRGHVGGHHEPVKRTADFAGYIEKDLHTAWLLINIANGPTEETSGAEAAGGGDASSSGSASPNRASAESHDG